MLLSQNIRGNILAADGQVLAESTAGPDGRIRRNYPFGEIYSHIVGFDIYGKSGIENEEDFYLVRSGIPLSSKAAYDDAGQKYPGNEVITTLDPVLQEAAYDAMGAYKGAIIVSEPHTGKILAMVSKPDFDPNTIRDTWEGYLADTTTGTLLNRAAQGLYPPGSTFKILDALAFMETDPEGAENFTYQCSGSFSVDGITIHCYHNESHGLVDFKTAFADSCNSAFAMIGSGLEEKPFQKLLDNLLFDQPLPYEMPSAQSHAGLKGADTEARLQLAIGQGETTMSPLHLNMITAAIANNGVMMKPYVVDHVQTAEGKLIEQINPVRIRQIAEEKTISRMKELMAAVVEEGTASRLSGASYTAAGKTGSAEYNVKTKESHAWFTGFAPVDDPRICITVIIEGAGSGGGYAVPMARTVLDAYFEK